MGAFRGNTFKITNIFLIAERQLQAVYNILVFLLEHLSIFTLYSLPVLIFAVVFNFVYKEQTKHLYPLAEKLLFTLNM